MKEDQHQELAVYPVGVPPRYGYIHQDLNTEDNQQSGGMKRQVRSEKGNTEM